MNDDTACAIRERFPAALHARGRPSRPPPAPRHALRGQRLPAQPDRPFQEPPRPHHDRQRGRAGLSRSGNLRQRGANLHSHCFPVSTHIRDRLPLSSDFTFFDITLFFRFRFVFRRNQGNRMWLLFKLAVIIFSI